MNACRIGYGEDIHRLVPGRKLVLAGVEIPFERGLLGHSDADCALHAIADSLLGAASLGDIGDHFSVDDPKWEGADSKDILRATKAFIQEKGYSIVNLDLSISCEKPRLSPYRPAMVESVANCLNLNPSQVSVKLMTNEGLDAVGEGKAIRSVCVCLLERNLDL